jgi:D-alanyl-D-alanine carboxypeptidase
LKPLSPASSTKIANTQLEDKSEFILNRSSSHSNVNSISFSPLRSSPSQAWLQTIEDGIINLSKSITAETFIVHDAQYDKVLLAKGEWIKREMASLTKIMTCYSAIKFCEKYNIPIKTTKFEVSMKAARTGGTSAKLLPLTYMTIEDLLYGLMLPSGNDAGVCLAENIGRIIRLTLGENKNPNIVEKSLTSQSDFEYFIELMNTNAYELGLRNTKFKNPHGLNCPENYSTCQDLLKLCLMANRLKLFQKIVKKKTYIGKFLIKKLVPTEPSTSINKIEENEKYKMTEPNFYNHSSNELFKRK